LSQINDTFFTVHIKWPKIQPSTSMHFATRLRRSHVFRQNSSWCFYCGQQHPKCESSIRLVQPLLFCKLHSSSNPINKNSNLVRCGDSHICVSITFQNWIHGFFFSQWQAEIHFSPDSHVLPTLRISTYKFESAATQTSSNLPYYTSHLSITTVF